MEKNWSLSDIVNLSGHDDPYKKLVYDSSFDIRKLPAEKSVVGKKDVRIVIAYLIILVSSFLLPLIVIFKGISDMILFSFLTTSPMFLIASLLLINKLLYNLRITVSRDEVFYSKRNLFGTSEWREPFSSYDGILIKKRKHGGQGYHRYEVTLHHKNVNHCVQLWNHFKWEKEAINIWELTAKDLHMPTLKEDENREVVEQTP